MYTKEYFLDRFRHMETQALIQNALRGLTEEAIDATRDILAERGVEGDALELQISGARRDLIERAGVTNQCDYCGNGTMLSAIREGHQKFCSEKCREESRLVAKSIDLAPDLVYQHAVAMHFGPCPRCGNTDGAVEMRVSHHVVSAIWYFSNERSVELCCRSCGRSRNLMATLTCAAFGWWSLPGLLCTPEMIIRNVAAMFRRDNASGLSDELLFQAQLDLARRMPSMPWTTGAVVES